jgi:hypothetical protein
VIWRRVYESGELGWAWWYASIIQALGRLRQEDSVSKGSLGYRARPFQKPTPSKESGELV